VAAVSVLTAIVILTIVVFDLKSASDPAHIRLPYIYLAYIVAGIGWYLLRRKTARAKNA